MNAIETKAVTKRFGDVTAVDALDLTVRRGELFALLGINGAGKTTLIRMLAGLAAPISGDVTVLGHSLPADADGVHRCIALSPQETAVAPNLTVRENLELMAGLYGFDKAGLSDRVERQLDALGLRQLERRSAGKLSGGWMRRLSLAMALIAEPELIFLDEPTLGLDVLARHELWELIESLRGRVTVLLTTHYLEEAEALADRVGFLQAGRLRFVGTVEEAKAASGTDSLEKAFLFFAKEGM